MNEWRVIFATVVIFGAGVVSGGLLVNYADVSHLRAVPAAAASPGGFNTGLSTNTESPAATVRPAKPGVLPKPRQPEILSQQFMGRLQWELRLTQAQREEIGRILAESQNEMRQAVQGVRQLARQRIRQQLNEDQKRRFDDLFKLRHGVKKTTNVTNLPDGLPPEGEPTNAVPSV